MARPLRIEYPGAFYHVINCGQSRLDIFLEDKARQSFIDLLGEITRLWKVEDYAYPVHCPNCGGASMTIAVPSTRSGQASKIRR
jgi:hypothetical protein